MSTIAEPAPAPTPAPAAPPTDPAPAPAPTPTPAAEPTPAATTRPEWFPEKYWKDGGPADIEKLGRSYQELHTAFGAKNPHLAEVPADPSGYAFKPEKLPEGVTWSEDNAARMAAKFHELQIGNTQAAGIAAAFAEIEAENIAAAAAAYQKQLDDGRAALIEKWGGEEAYTAKCESLSALVSERLGADPDADAELFNNPRVVEFLAKTDDYVKSLEKQLGEDSLAKSRTAVAPGQSFASKGTEAKRIMTDATHPEHAAYMAGDPAVVNKVVAMLGGTA